MKKFIVVKYSGKVLGRQAQAKNLAQGLVSLAKKYSVVLVHGGGVEISGWLEKMAIGAKFIQGLRYTDQPAMDVVEAVLSGLVNKSWVSLINRQGGRAVGISGRDGQLIVAERIKKLGLVGEPKKINLGIIKNLLSGGYLPVVSPVGTDVQGKALNINADLVSAGLAVALKADRLIFLTDVRGVYDAHKKILPVIKASDINGLIREGVISSGMIPKIKSALKAVEKGVKEVVITDSLVNQGTRILK
ncbi:MAG: acetylglutamate kinase [Elusimicrobiota bacterium]